MWRSNNSGAAKAEVVQEGAMLLIGEELHLPQMVGLVKQGVMEENNFLIQTGDFYFYPLLSSVGLEKSLLKVIMELTERKALLVPEVDQEANGVQVAVVVVHLVVTGEDV